PATLKFEHDGSPPLQARAQSVICPGDRVNNCGGSTYSAHRAAGRSCTPSPRLTVVIIPLVPTNTAPFPDKTPGSAFNPKLPGPYRGTPGPPAPCLGAFAGRGAAGAGARPT